MRVWSLLLSLGSGLLCLATKPIVLIHGILSDTVKVGHVADWLHNSTGAEVYNIEIGLGKQTSINMPIADQLDIFCGKVHDLLKGSDGINIIGISQGGLLARGYVEHCNDPPVESLITWVTPHGGVYSFPIPDIYSPDKQATGESWVGYWRDPFQYRKYLEYSDYLAELNNERSTDNFTRNADNIRALKQFVMVWSPLDDVLDPPESGKFSMYVPGILPLRLVPVEKTGIWQDLGLDVLSSSGRLHMFQTDCDHADHVTPQCITEWGHYTLPYLS